MNTEFIEKYIQIGANDKGWYEQCRTTFINLFGEDKLQVVCKLFAATSINTSLKANIRLFRKALRERELGLPRGKYLPVIAMQLDLIEKGLPLSGRKINNFADAMYGVKTAVVVDVWLCRAFGIDTKRRLATTGRTVENTPTKKQYDSVEAWVTAEAHKRGLEPRQLCAMIWAGVRITKTGDRNTHYREALNYHFNNLFGCI